MSGSSYDHHDPETGLLNLGGLEQALDAELSRAARHELPISLVLIEISGPLTHNGGQERLPAIVRRVARAIETRIRAEDRAARIGRLKFAVVAVETSENMALAGDLAELVGKALIAPGEDGAGLSVSVGAIDCQYDEVSRDGLLEQAEKALAAAMLTGGGVPCYAPAGSVRLHRPNGQA